MSGATLLLAHNRAAILQKGRRIADELAGEARDPSNDLTMAERIALAALSLAIDLEVARRAEIERAKEVLGYPP